MPANASQPTKRLKTKTSKCTSREFSLLAPKTQPKNTAKTPLNLGIVSKRTPTKALFTQIQSGKFKGKKLVLPNFTTTRSTKNRVKACVFNVLRPNLAGKIFIEVFGGSGAMALEALSNGAEQVFIIEKDDKAYQIALKNAQNINATFADAINSSAQNTLNSNPQIFAAQNPAQVYKGDSFELLPSLIQGTFTTHKTTQGGETAPQTACANLPAHQSQILSKKPIIAYFDPPFHYRNDFENIYERIFSLICSLQSSNLEYFIIEHSTQAIMPAQINNFYKSKSKPFGNTTLTFYRKDLI